MTHVYDILQNLFDNIYVAINLNICILFGLSIYLKFYFLFLKLYLIKI